MPNLQNLQYLNPRANTEADPTHEYVDLQIINNSLFFQEQPIIFNQVKTDNIVDKCNDYYLSLIRFSLMSSLPQIIPSMALGDPNNLQHYTGQTNYVVNIGYGETIQTATFATTGSALFFQNEVNVEPPKYFPISNEEVYSNPFFYLYSVENFLKIVNKGLSSCFQSAKEAYAGLLDSAVAPKFVFNNNTNKINLVVSKEFVEGLATNTFYISMNNPLFSLFDTFPSYRNTYTIQIPNSNNVLLSLNNNYGVSSFQDPDAGGTPLVLYTFSQQTSSVVSWVPYTSLVFTTSLIPINPENSGVPQYLGRYIANNNAVANTAQILTDFNVPLEIGTEGTRSMIYYLPQAEYRLLDLVGDAPLKYLSLQVFWKDIYGDLHQMTLKQGCGASVKLLLRKKSFNGI